MLQSLSSSFEEPARSMTGDDFATDHVHNLGPVNEDIAMRLWIAQPWGRHSIQDVKRREVKVIFLGWLNHGPGPDFFDAIFKYGNGEIQKGDVEIHVRSSDWLRHGHHRDPAYNNTRLHVLLYCDSISDPRVTQAGSPLIEIELGLLCAPVIERIRACKSIQPSGTGPHPTAGVCHERMVQAGMEKAGETLDRAGEARLTLKSRFYESQLAVTNHEEVLYRGLMKAMGYAAFKNQFELLAAHASLALLRRVSTSAKGERRALIFEATLLGMAGFLPGPICLIEYNDPASIRYAKKLNKIWIEISDRFGLKPSFKAVQWPLSGARPANYPMGRLAGLAHFLSAHIETGLETVFGALIDQFPDDAPPKNKRDWLKKAFDLFPTPGGHYFAWRYTFDGKLLKRKRSLIGPGRVGLFLINVLIPFFLARYRSTDKVYEIQKLRKIYFYLPKQPSNSVEKKMAERLFNGSSKQGCSINGLRQQGLIHIYNNFCVTSAKGCVSCGFDASS